MRTLARWGSFLGLATAALPTAGRAAMQEQIGGWTLTCRGETRISEPCLMRLTTRILDKAGLTADLEVQARGTTLVPVLSLRGASPDMLMTAALAAKTDASIKFPGHAAENLDCAATKAGYFCVPDEPAGRRLAASLPAARAATVRVAVTVSGMGPLHPQEKSLDLSGTSAALARLRTVGPSQIPGPITMLASQSPAGLLSMADKAFKAAGYPNGAAQLQALMAKYMKQQP